MGFCHQLLKGGQVSLIEILLRDPRIKAVADGLRTGVHGEVLRAGSGLHIFSVALQTLDESRAQLAAQVGILPISLLSSPPMGVPEDIDVR